MKISIIVLGIIMSFILKINYGQREVVSSSIDFSKSKNAVSFNYGDLLSSRLSISYERLFFNGKMGVKVPLSVSYLLNRDKYSNLGNPIMQGGLDVNYYPLGQKKLTFYTGISGKTGFVYSSSYHYCETCHYIDLIYYPNVIEKNVFVSGYVNNGLLLHFNTHFSISGQFGIGIKNIIGDNKAVNPSPSVIGELNGSFKF